MPSASPHVIVVGGGAAGCASAYYLSLEGARVTIVEREAIAHGSSGFSLGRIDPVAGDIVPGDMAALALESFKLHQSLYPRLLEESGVDHQWRLVTSLELCMDEPDITRRRVEMARWRRAPGFTVEWLSDEEALKLEPRLSPEVRAAVMLEPMGVLDSYRFTLALAQAAERHGATMKTARVSGLERRGDRVTGVRLDGGEMLSCDAAVIATGPWAAEASGWLGVKVPVGPSKGQIVYLEGLDPPLKQHLHGPVSMLHKADGKVHVAATREMVGFDTTTTPEARDKLIAQAVQTMPCLADQRLVLQTACLRPMTPDSQPIIGRVPGWDNLIFAGGGYSKGIALAPAMGRAATDLSLKGYTDLPIDSLGLERFQK